MKRLVSLGRVKKIVVLAFGGVLAFAVTVNAQERVDIFLNVHKDAQVTQIAYYLKVQDNVKCCWVDVHVKNVSNSNEGFEVIVDANDEGGGATLIGEDKGPKGFLEPKKIQKVSIMIPMEKLPSKLAIEINR
jgi:hypothetical protein